MLYRTPNFAWHVVQSNASAQSHNYLWELKTISYQVKEAQVRLLISDFFSKALRYEEIKQITD